MFRIVGNVFVLLLFAASYVGAASAADSGPKNYKSPDGSYEIINGQLYIRPTTTPPPPFAIPGPSFDPSSTSPVAPAPGPPPDSAGPSPQNATVPPSSSEIFFAPPVSTAVALNKALHLPSELKAVEPAQLLLSYVNDVRDLVTLQLLVRANQRASEAAAVSYSQLVETLKSAQSKGALAQQELDQYVYYRDFALANAAQFKADGESYAARVKSRKLQIAFLKGTPFDLKALHAAYVEEWTAQCRSTHAGVAASLAQLKLNRAVYQRAKEAHGNAANSYFDLTDREKDLAAARADLESKKELDDTCLDELPTLRDVENLQANKKR